VSFSRFGVSKARANSLKLSALPIASLEASLFLDVYGAYWEFADLRFLDIQFKSSNIDIWPRDPNFGT
jgi:hypothetical protein